MKRVGLTFATLIAICGIMTAISRLGKASVFASVGRDIDPGIATRRRFLQYANTTFTGNTTTISHKENDMVARCAHPFGAPSRTHVFFFGLW